MDSQAALKGNVVQHNKRVISCCFGFLILIVSLLALVRLWPSGPYYLVLGSSSTSMAQLFQAIEAGNGSFVREGVLPGTAIVFSTASDFARRAFSAGALVVLNAPETVNCGK